MADVYAADVLAATLQREADHLAGVGPIMHGRPAVAAEAQRDDLLALVPDGQSLVIDRDGRVWGLEQLGPTVRDYAGKLLYRKVPVTSEEE